MKKKLVAFIVLLGLCGFSGQAFAQVKLVHADSSNLALMCLSPFGEFPLEPEATAKIRYNLRGCLLDFVLTARNLNAGSRYGLYSKGVLLGYGMANEFGEVHLNKDVPCDSFSLDNGRFSLWEVHVSTDGDITYIEKVDHILWSGADGFNGFTCDCTY